MTILKLHSEPLQDTWLDDYGHLNEAYYLVPFSNATWRLQDHFGIGVNYFAETGCAIYTVETHLRYLAEVRQPALLEIVSTIVRSDAKRIWIAHQMVVDDSLRATGEFMALHYNTREQRTTPMPAAVQQRLCEAESDQEAGEGKGKPDWIAGQISLERRSTGK